MIVFGENMCKSVYLRNHSGDPPSKPCKYVKKVTSDIKRQLSSARVSQFVPVSGLDIKRFYEIFPSLPICTALPLCIVHAAQNDDKRVIMTRLERCDTDKPYFLRS